MEIFTFERKKGYLVTSALLVLWLFAVPISVLAQSTGRLTADTNSIDTLRRMGKAFAEIAQKASPAVVGLKAERTVTRQYSIRQWPFGEPSDPFSDDLFDYFFRRSPSPRERTPQREYQVPQTAQGSGFIISADGYILTNNHMVGEAEKVEIELADGRKFTAEIKGADPESDVAVVKIDAKDLPYLELANSDNLEVGEWVLAIGNPFGLSHTVTAGIVSAKGRNNVGLTTYEDFIQTDAAINFGNSGGPLLNLDGKVVGINTAILGTTGNIGIGFAIPINMAKTVYPQLIESGAVERGYLGLLPDNLTQSMAELLGLKDTKGVIISEITKDSAADKAGLKHNDVILEFNGKPVESQSEFRRNVALLKPGTEVEIVVWRDGKRKTLTAKLDKRPPLEELIRSSQPGRIDALGFSVQNLTDELAERYGFQGQNGVIVSSVEPGSQAAQEGLSAGMLIIEVNLKPVQNAREFSDAMEQAKKDKGKAILLVNDGQRRRYIELKLTEDK
jgi:serine protease Do